MPFILISVCTILFYYLFRWIFDYKLGILPFKEDLLNFWIPFSLPWITILFWMGKRIRILNLKNKWNGQLSFFYLFVMSVTTIIPLLISQNYLEKVSYDLISVKDITGVTESKTEKYYEVQSFKIAEKPGKSYFTTRTSGRNNQNLIFYNFFVYPFENTDHIWYGIQFSKTIHSRISRSKKDFELREFFENNKNELKNYDFQNVKYFEKLGYSDDKDGFLEAVKVGNPDIDKKKQIILIPKTNTFEKRLGNSLSWIFRSFGIGAFVVFIMIVIPKNDQNEFRKFKKGEPQQDDDFEFIMSFLTLKTPIKATAFLILLNLMVFVIMIFLGINIVSPTGKELLEIGANRRTEVINGEYWRLITSMFIQGGLNHLILNLFALVVSGFLLEIVIGKYKMFFVYLISGIISSAASIFWYNNTISVGASGAIFGLYGVMLAFNLFKIYPANMRNMVWTVLGMFAGVSLLLGLLPGIDNAAHIGGLISGFIIGVIWISIDKEKLIEDGFK